MTFSCMLCDFFMIFSYILYGVSYMLYDILLHAVWHLTACFISFSYMLYDI